VNLAIKESNISYQNSGINVRMVAAQPDPVPVDYKEKGEFDDHLAAFRKMDKIQKLRQQTQANVAVMLIDDSSACGLAADIMATKETAYAVVYHDCATGYYSFAHEIGHLQGARHNPEMDNSTAPFAYGHGFLDVPRKRRTVMSYDCSNRHCAERMPEWARAGGWGNATVSNDARVLNETAECVAAFK
jgi:hypothetical protein